MAVGNCPECDHAADLLGSWIVPNRPDRWTEAALAVLSRLKGST